MHIDYLRVSVTDRCNLRCVYCNPMGDCDFIDRREILRFEEIHRLVRLFAKCGMSKVRLTGGEPLVRKDVVNLVGKLASTGGIQEISLTTNGVLLAETAAELKAAGLSRVNVSVDSAETENYELITGFDFLGKVRVGIYKAIEVGLTPVKINTVILRGINEAQIPALAEMSVHMPVAVRFIEYCPTNRHTRPASDFVASGRVRRTIEERFGPLVRNVGVVGNGPAVYFKIKDSAGCVGFISGRTQFFCRRCNRLRLTSDGKVKPCLYSADGYNIKRLLRSGAGDEEVLHLIRNIVSGKGNHTKLNSFTEEFSMRSVGG